MFEIRFEDIDKDTILALLQDGAPEGKQLEYKQELPAGSNDARKEFAADISSFANASGGDIVYGIREERNNAGEKTGKPSEILGLRSISGDKEIQRLESMIRDNIEPRIAPAPQLKSVEGLAEGPVILLRVHKSWSAPHRVSLGASRFYSRTSNGKYPLDVTEIRTAFSASEDLPRQIQRFRDERLSNIIAGETPARLAPGPKVVLHAIPVSAATSLARIAGDELLERCKYILIPSFSGRDFRANFQGVFHYGNQEAEGTYEGYTQFFRTGAIESVATTFFVEENDPTRLGIMSDFLEEALIKALERYLGFFESSSIQPPITIHLSLLEVRGVRLHGSLDYGRHTIDEQNLIIPEVTIEALSVEPVEVLRPIFDVLWQSSGYVRCMDYDEDGKWTRG